jgi:hypothetical protein
MAGYSSTLLSKKLGIKSGQRLLVLGEPRGFRESLGDLPDGVKYLTRSTKRVDNAVVFVIDRVSLARRFAQLVPDLHTDGSIWIGWPKKSSGVDTDLVEDRIRQVGLDAGLVDVKVCAIDDVWSALKFVRRLRDRKK